MAEHLLFVGRMTSKFDNQSAALEDKKGLTVSGDLKYSLATMGVTSLPCRFCLRHLVTDFTHHPEMKFRIIIDT